MGRRTVYNRIYTEEIWAKVNEDNKNLLKDYLAYKTTGGRSPQTIYQYEQMIRLFFCWNYLHNKDTFFVDLKKRQLVSFFNYAITEMGWSSNRISTIKSSLSSMSDYIENVLDDEFPDFRNIVVKLETPVKQTVREKTVMSEEQIQDCLDKLVAARRYQAACYLALAVSCGARKAELIQFKANWFTDENIVYGCMWKTPEQIRTKGHGKQGKLLYKFTFIKSFKPYYEMWMKYRKENNIESEWLFIVKNDDDTYRQASISTADSICRTISAFMNTDFYSHCCRHRYVTIMKESKLPDDVIIALVGWEAGSGGAMCATYCDLDTADTLGDYFDENGIKKDIKTGTLNDI